MMDVTAIITRMTGRRFEPFDLPLFVPEIVRRCTREDLLFPLLDFLVGSVDNISSMEFKRYDSSVYQQMRDASAWGQPDPSMGRHRARHPSFPAQDRAGRPAGGGAEA